jgi:hypothetical protein
LDWLRADARDLPVGVIHRVFVFLSPRIINLILLIVFLVFSAPSYAENPSLSDKQGKLISLINGDYIGMEPMESLSPEDNAEWVHENTLIVRNNQVIIDEVPIFIVGGKKSYSSSDGGFRTYVGKFSNKDNQEFVELRLLQSDYTSAQVGKDPYNEIKLYSVKIAPEEIIFNGVRYKQTTLNHTERERLEQILNHEERK